MTTISPTCIFMLNTKFSWTNNVICLAKKSSCLITTTAHCSSSVNNTTTTLKSIEESSNNISPTPWLMLPSKEAKNNDNISQFHTLYDRCFYDIGEKEFVPKRPKTWNLDENQNQETLSNDVKCVGASHGWLAFIDPSDCSLYLSNPLTTQTIQLPPIETLPSFGRAFYCELDDGSFRRVGHVYKCSTGSDDQHETFKNVADYFVEKIILTSSPVEKDCMVILSTHSALTTLAFCKIGDDKWTNLDQVDGGGFFSDVIYSSKDNRLYARSPNSQDDDDSELEIWDLSDHDASFPFPKRIRLKYSSSSLFLFCRHQSLQMKYKSTMRKKGMTREYLVESSGKLLMVIRNFALHVSEHGKILSLKDDKTWRYPYKTLSFDVLEFDQDENKFKNVIRDLGDMALFVGINHSIAVNAREVPGIKPNAIYFGDHHLLMEVYDLYDLQLPYIMSGGHDFGIYNLEDDSITSPCYPTQSKQFLPPPVWIVT